MPSGSHGGSPGSHSSGGSSFGGSSSRSGSSFNLGGRNSSSVIHIHHGPRYFRFWPGGPVFYVTGRQTGITSLFLFLAVFALIILIPMSMALTGVKDSISKVEEDYAYYQVMIKEANKKPTELIRNATVTDMFRNEYADKYYVTYELNIDGSSEKLEGYSFAIYSREEAFALLNSTDFKVAINKAPVTSSTDSIPLDYADTVLEDDGEYIRLTNTLKNLNGWIIAVRVMSISFFALSVIMLFVGIRKKKENETTGEVSFTTSSGNSNSTTEQNSPSAQQVEQDYQPVKTHIYCDYCGGEVGKNTVKCPHCGAKIKY